MEIRVPCSVAEFVDWVAALPADAQDKPIWEVIEVDGDIIRLEEDHDG